MLNAGWSVKPVSRNCIPADRRIIRYTADGLAGRAGGGNYDPPSFVLTFVNVAEAFVPTA